MIPCWTPGTKCTPECGRRLWNCCARNSRHQSTMSNICETTAGLTIFTAEWGYAWGSVQQELQLGGLIISWISKVHRINPSCFQWILISIIQSNPMKNNCQWGDLNSQPTVPPPKHTPVNWWLEYIPRYCRTSLETAKPQEVIHMVAQHPLYAMGQ